MARICQVTGKRTVTGNKVSHSNIKTKRRFLPNLHSKRLWLESEQRFVRLRISANGLRTIDKLGVEAIVGALRANGSNI
jgi:large subunit ribosomal protein L28